MEWYHKVCCTVHHRTLSAYVSGHSQITLFPGNPAHGMIRYEAENNLGKVYILWQCHAHKVAGLCAGRSKSSFSYKLSRVQAQAEVRSCLIGFDSVRFRTSPVKFEYVHLSCSPFNSVQVKSAQFISIPCSSMQCTAVPCHAAQCKSIQFSSIQFSLTQFKSSQLSSIQFNSVQFDSIGFDLDWIGCIQCNPTPFSSTQVFPFIAVQIKPVQFCSIQFNSSRVSALS